MNRILEAAFELFSMGDYHSVSLADIAERVGIKKSSIYAHFSSKEELFLKVIDRDMEGVYVYISERLQEIKLEDTHTFLYECLKSSVNYAVSNPMSRNLLQRILYSPPTELLEQIRNRTSKLDKRIRNIQLKAFKIGIDTGKIKKCNLEDLIYSFNALVKGNLAIVMRDEAFSFDKMDFSWKIYWNGIKN